MEFFKETRYDFLGRKWRFILPSLMLLLAGLASLVANGGPRYGVEFQGGAVMELRWPRRPPVERIRAALEPVLGNVTVVAVRDVTGSNEVRISSVLPAQSDLTALRPPIEKALSALGTGHSVRSFEAIGPQIGADLRRQALFAVAGASGGMLAYLTLRFRAAYAVAAVIAMAHDALITVGIFSLLHEEISLTVVAALLTLIGYSMNDTIVVFDRIRENRRVRGREPLAETINRSINQTLSRTVLTSGLTLLTAFALFFFAGPVLRGFSLALVIGIIVGTFSSVFIASPILLAWEQGSSQPSSGRAVVPVGGVR